MAANRNLSSYRWVILCASGIMLAVTMGATMNGISAYIVPMEEAYGWSRSETSMINVIGLIGLALGGLITGPMADKYGTRRIVVLGTLVLGLCYLSASQATALWQIYFLMAIAGAFGASAIFAPIFAAIGNWFSIGAGLAIGIASAGQAMGQGGVPYLSSISIERHGISTTLGLTGVIMLAVMLPLATLFKDPPKLFPLKREGVTSSVAVYPPERIIIPTLCAAIFLCCTCMSIPLMHLVPLVRDRGFSNEEAGSVIFVMLMSGIFGRVAFGKLVDVIGAVPAYMTATSWMSLLILGFTQIETLDTFKIYAIIYGFGYAGVMTGVLASASLLTHPTRRGAALGKVNMFGALGHANGGFLGGFLFVMSGTYSTAYTVAALAGVLNLIIVGKILLPQNVNQTVRT